MKGIPVLVTQITNISSGNSVTFKYNGNKLIETTDGELKSLYQYTGNVITQIKEYENDELIKTADFTYHKNGTLKGIRVDGTRENYGHYTEEQTFTYPTPSTIVCTEFELYDNYEDQKPHQLSTVYTMNKGNMILKKNSSHEGKSVELEVLKSYTYDKNNNPYLNILGYDKIMPYILESYDEFMTGKNNMTSYKLFQHKQPADLGLTANFTITYNKNNFPEKIVSKYYNKDGVLYDHITYTYNYNQ
ncbi:hypothetical protein ACM46_13345 [Chryseobacterium angstadtii]|uniref:DUF4595 domain-containing protein n=2 Tax=Chryseobacterium angstadtii TaxID=558151 RepID=A0A0J7L803_9FLAO|nr:hypothetical protein ACM46_13345 [Chryseobacterium angstadtii]